MTPAGIEPATFRFVAQQINHRDPLSYFIVTLINYSEILIALVVKNIVFY